MKTKEELEKILEIIKTVRDSPTISNTWIYILEWVLEVKKKE